MLYLKKTYLESRVDTYNNINFHQHAAPIHTSTKLNKYLLVIIQVTQIQGCVRENIK